MSKKILIVRHPSGIKRTIECNGSITYKDLFQTVSKQFGLDSEKHELKLGPETVNMSVIVEASKLPETAVLDIAPRTGGRSEPLVPQVFVQLCFADEGDQYDYCSKVMKFTDSLWNVIEELVPSHMAYVDEDISLTYLRTNFQGKRRLSKIRLEELCGIEPRLFFTCSRDYLRKPYSHRGANVNAKLQIGNKKRGERRVGTVVHLESVDGNMIEYETLKIAPRVGNLNPDVIELNERKGKIYKKFSVGVGGENEVVGGLQPSDIALERGKIIIRVVFPNHTMLEASFFMRESIGDVKQFVNRYLRNEAKKNYYFYTIRPRLIADPKRKLETMKSSPPGYLWYSGKAKDPIFTDDIESSLKGKVFSYVSRDACEKSQIRVASSSYEYMWKAKADKGSKVE